MSKEWSSRSPAERRALEAAFVARHGAELLLGGDDEHEPAMDDETVPGRRPLPFASLHAALQRPGPLPAKVSAALCNDPRLRDDLAMLLQRRAHRHVPRAAAAAGRGALRRREVEGFTVRVVESRASSDQVYLLVELPESVLQRTSVAERRQLHDGSRADQGPEPNTVDADALPDAERGDPRVDGARGGARLDAETVAPVQLVVKTVAEEFLKLALPPPEARTIRLVLGADDPLVQAVGEPASEIFLW